MSNSGFSWRWIVTSLPFAALVGLALPAAHSIRAQQTLPPYPQSPLIKEVVWDPVNTMIRKAKDGDNWRFREFGLVGFVNFGRGYSGARDEYVYAYSHDGPQADTPADQFVLMRVQKDHLMEREAWEFFSGFGAPNEPRWTEAIERREGVFRNHDACLRSAMTYNAGLQRYLWWQQIPQPPGHPDRGDTRFEGGFAIYDAPEPWGPWTTAYYTDKWDVGPGEHGDFPSKWMSADGRVAWLLFSGNDAFSVRKAKFVIDNVPAAGKNATEKSVR